MARIEMEASSCSLYPFLFPPPAPCLTVRDLTLTSMDTSAQTCKFCPGSPCNLQKNHWKHPGTHVCGPQKQLWPIQNFTVPSGLEGKQGTGSRWAHSPGQTPHPVRRNSAGPSKIRASGWGPLLPRANGSTGGEDVS